MAALANEQLPRIGYLRVAAQNKSSPSHEQIQHARLAFHSVVAQGSRQHCLWPRGAGNIAHGPVHRLVQFASRPAVVMLANTSEGTLAALAVQGDVERERLAMPR